MSGGKYPAVYNYWMRKLKLKQAVSKPGVSSPLSPSSPTKLNLAQTNLPTDEASSATAHLQGQLLLLEERGKNIQSFYEKKLSQLRSVLGKQRETKNELTHELFQLSLEQHQQQQRLTELRKILLPSQSRQQAGRERIRMREYNQPRSRSKGRGILFGSGILGQSISGSSRLTLKKCKSSGLIASEYFPNEGLTDSHTHYNPESAVMLGGKLH